MVAPQRFPSYLDPNPYAIFERRRIHRDLGTETMIEAMGQEVVKSRARCAALALGTAQAAINQLRKDKAYAELSGKLAKSQERSVKGCGGRPNSVAHLN